MTCYIGTSDDEGGDDDYKHLRCARNGYKKETSRSGFALLDAMVCSLPKRLGNKLLHLLA